MANPKFSDGLGEIKLKYQWQNEVEAREIIAYVDSDWSGCTVKSRPTSGGFPKVGEHVLETWLTTQATIATQVLRPK
jgi:hypothetical protein